MVQSKLADFVIQDVRSWRPSRKNKLAHVSLPRRHGTLIVDVAFSDELTLAIEGEVFKNTAIEMRDYSNNLGARLMNLGKDKLYLRDDGRFVYAICSSTAFPSFDAARSANGIIAAYSLEFTAGDPFWYSGTEAESHQANISGVSTYNFSVTNNGTIR